MFVDASVTLITNGSECLYTTGAGVHGWNGAGVHTVFVHFLRVKYSTPNVTAAAIAMPARTNMPICNGDRRQSEAPLLIFARTLGVRADGLGRIDRTMPPDVTLAGGADVTAETGKDAGATAGVGVGVGATADVGVGVEAPRGVGVGVGATVGAGAAVGGATGAADGTPGLVEGLTVDIVSAALTRARFIFDRHAGGPLNVR